MGRKRVNLPKSYWSMDEVRRVCIARGWYNAGNNNDYEKLLGYVMNHSKSPSQLEVYIASEDIATHSVPAPKATDVYRELEKKTLYYFKGDES